VLQPGFGLLELARSSSPTTATFQNLVVTVSRDNLFFFNGQPTTFDGLRQSLTRAAQQTRNAELIIKADRQVPYETVVKITGMAFEVGIGGVNLATRPEVPAAGPAK
jgi:biopolymer transport protein ExbD